MPPSGGCDGIRVNIDFNMNDLSLLTDLENLALMGGHGDEFACKVSPTLLSSLTNLSSLFLDKCDLRNLSHDTFGALVNLHIFHMKNSINYSHINLDLLPRLKWLNLDNENSTGERNRDLPLFQRLSKELRIFEIGLDISEAGLKTLKNFSHENLLMIDVKCEEWKLDDHWFGGFPSLKALKMDSCSLRKLPVSEKMSKLEWLNLQQNKLVSLEDRGGFLANLKKLNLNTNALKLDRPDVFKGLAQLSKLVLTYNEIDIIHKEAFRGLNKLETLDLSNNQLSNLDPETFAHVPQLKHLDLSWNRVTIDKSTFGGHLKQLKTLIIKNNIMKNCQDGVFASLVNCELLDLSWNSIPRIGSNMLSGLSSLKILNLSNNEIDEIASDAFATTSSLEDVVLVYNRLTNEIQDELRVKLSSTQAKAARIHLDFEFDSDWMELLRNKNSVFTV